MADPADTTFAARYGPWALVAGASDGVGAAYARAMADRGLNVVLLARRERVLEELAATIRAETGVETRVAAVDLSEDDAMAKIVDVTAGLEIGMVLYCAGADPNYEPFLANPVEVPLAMVRRNCVVPLQVCHHFAAPMVARGRGGIVLVSSGAGLIGAPNMVAYAATKAFDLVMAEALWAELHESGVDVLALVLGLTDTPALRKLLARRGALADADDPSPIPGAATPDEVVAQTLANLSDGPTWFVGGSYRQVVDRMGTMSRSDLVKAMSAAQQNGIMADKRGA
jgi:short-subunit dehydrogenase